MGLLRQRLKELQESLRSGNIIPESPNPVETYNPPQMNVPNSQPATTPIPTNTQAPKTTPISVPKPAAPSSAKTTSTPKINPKTGKAGAKVFSDINAKRPTLGENSINDLIDAYNAGYNDTDISTEIKANADAGDYTSEIEAVINAGKADAKAKLESDLLQKSGNTASLKNTSSNPKSTGATEKTGAGKKDSDIEEARKEHLLQIHNAEQAKAKVDNEKSNDDLSAEALRKEINVQRKFNNLEKNTKYTLNVPSTPRQEGDWCWAAVMSTTDKYYNGEKEGKEQDVLRNEVNPDNLPDTKFGAPACRDHVNFNLDKLVDRAPSYETIEANMRAGQPIVLWTQSKFKHFIVITGCYVSYGVKYVIINENRDGKQYPIRCDDLSRGFTTSGDPQTVIGYYTTSKKN